MDKHSNTLLYVAAGIFIFGLICSFVVPSLGKVSNSQTTKLESVTNGGDYKPPTGWTPGP